MYRITVCANGVRQASERTQNDIPAAECRFYHERLLFLYFSALTGLMLQAGQTVPGYWQQDARRLMKIILR